MVMRDLKIMERGRTDRGAREAPPGMGTMVSSGSAIVLVLRSEDWISVREEEWMLRCVTGETAREVDEVEVEIEVEVETSRRLVPVKLWFSAMAAAREVFHDLDGRTVADRCRPVQRRPRPAATGAIISTVLGLRRLGVLTGVYSCSGWQAPTRG